VVDKFGFLEVHLGVLLLLVSFQEIIGLPVASRLTRIVACIWWGTALPVAWRRRSRHLSLRYNRSRLRLNVLEASSWAKGKARAIETGKLLKKRGRQCDTQ
jgi:hypothetical protein